MTQHYLFSWVYFICWEGLDTLLGTYFDVDTNVSDFNSASSTKALKLDCQNAIDADFVIRSPSHVNLFGLSEEVEVM